MCGAVRRRTHGFARGGVSREARGGRVGGTPHTIVCGPHSFVYLLTAVCTFYSVEKRPRWCVPPHSPKNQLFGAITFFVCTTMQEKSFLYGRGGGDRWFPAVQANLPACSKLVPRIFELLQTIDFEPLRGGTRFRATDKLFMHCTAVPDPAYPSQNL